MKKIVLKSYKEFKKKCLVENDVNIPYDDKYKDNYAGWKKAVNDKVKQLIEERYELLKTKIAKIGFENFEIKRSVKQESDDVVRLWYSIYISKDSFNKIRGDGEFDGTTLDPLIEPEFYCKKFDFKQGKYFFEVYTNIYKTDKYSD